MEDWNLEPEELRIHLVQPSCFAGIENKETQRDIIQDCSFHI